MKKKYTKKQITEAIAYWKKRLNESFLSTCDGTTSGVMCYTHMYEAYDTGDEDWLYVAPNFNKFIDAFAEVVSNEYTVIIFYKGKAAVAGTPDFAKFMLAIRNESLKKKGAVSVKWLNIDESFDSVNVNDYDENDGNDVDINFYDCTTAQNDDSGWSPDGYHIFACS